MILINRCQIKPRTGTAFTVKKDQVIRIIDVEGQQVSDLVCFAQRDIEESLSSGRTIDRFASLQAPPFKAGLREAI